MAAGLGTEKHERLAACEIPSGLSNVLGFRLEYSKPLQLQRMNQAIGVTCTIEYHGQLMVAGLGEQFSNNEVEAIFSDRSHNETCKRVYFHTS